MTAAEPEALSAAEIIGVLQRSHERLAGLLGPLDADQVSAPSYDDDWTIAQVASHLGSGAEIFELFVEAGRTHTSAPGMERLQAIWDVWNAKDPERQAIDALSSDARFLAGLDTLTDEQRTSWAMELFGSEQTLASVLRMRVSEHALHTWDIAVALDPTSTVAGDAVDLIVDTLPQLVGRVGKPADDAATIKVLTSDPERAFALELSTDAVSLTPAEPTDASSTSELRLPAEALVRLVYGRLGVDHTPDAVDAHEIDLDVLRRSFPGF